jgi:osmotically-inducible protein OsmY
MKNLTTFLIGCLFLFGAAACQDPAKTSSSAPSNNDDTPQSPNAGEVKSSANDAQSSVRRSQLDSDIRAREQRNNATGGDADRAKADLKSEVRSKLEANLPSSQLAVETLDGRTVTVSGTVSNQEQLSKIEPLAKEIKGVNSVVVKAIVAQPNN